VNEVTNMNMYDVTVFVYIKPQLLSYLTKSARTLCDSKQTWTNINAKIIIKAKLTNASYTFKISNKFILLWL